MTRRVWKGPFLKTEDAATYCGMSVRTFARVVNSTPLLLDARVRRGSGTTNPALAYPQQALDHAMAARTVTP